MKLYVAAAIGFAVAAAVGVSPSFGQATQDEPTTGEIRMAYGSVFAQSGDVIPAISWQLRRVTKVRGWALRFKLVSRKQGIGIVTREYTAVARKSGSCAEYRITDTRALPQTSRITPTLVVEEGGVKACR